MPDDPRGGNGNIAGPAPARRRTKPSLAAGLLLVAAVLLPAIFWQSTWFGGSLSTDQIREYLTDPDQLRHAQHALEQMTQLMERNDPSAAELYPLVIDLADHDKPQIRMMVAWVLGWDADGEGFRNALQGLLRDPVLVVRQNAALSLTKFGDDSAKPLLLDMLEPHDVQAPVSGTISDLVGLGQPTRPIMQVATITQSDGTASNVPAPIGGEVMTISVTDGDQVSFDDTICTIAPAEDQVYKALRGLVLIGAAEDLPRIRAALEKRGRSTRVSQQGELTIKTIEQRAASAEAISKGESDS